MAGSKRLIVGLGNPGEEYAGTRHNIGYDVVDQIAEKLKIDLRKKGEALIGWGKWRGRPVGLLKPLTFMNRSGLAVEKIARDQKLAPEDIFIIVDDINLPVGKCRIRSKGGDGGHNGIEDIIDWLDEGGTREELRSDHRGKLEARHAAGISGVARTSRRMRPKS